MMLATVIHIIFTLMAVIVSVAVYDSLQSKKLPKWAAIIVAIGLVVASWFLFGWFTGQFFG